ncbi:MAG: radical SAM protein [Candidatus Saganbacteria bacterium]|nr:radical SAM protein [Candidatus Saganbacteria bacterium]
MNSKLLGNCRLCGHRCGVNRVRGELGKCRAGLAPEVASYCVHHGEEPAISGSRGSGTIFFAHCSLRCVFCQNYEISQMAGSDREKQGLAGMGREKYLLLPAHPCHSPSLLEKQTELAEIMLELQDRGVHNINLVSPTHYGPQIVEALEIAREEGLKLPVVYNSGGYDSLELLKELAGKIDIYLPDLKYFSDDSALKYSGAKNYVETVKAAVAEMFRQVGPGKLIVRHLVLPNGLAHSFDALDYLASLSKDIWVSLMAQYSPQHRAGEFPELNRKLSPAEYQRVVAHAGKLGLHNLYVQELSSSEVYLPDFQRAEPFSR